MAKRPLRLFDVLMIYGYSRSYLQWEWASSRRNMPLYPQCFLSKPFKAYIFNATSHAPWIESTEIRRPWHGQWSGYPKHSSKCCKFTALSHASVHGKMFWKYHINIWLVVSTQFEKYEPKWVDLPQIGVKIKKIFETTTRICISNIHPINFNRPKPKEAIQGWRLPSGPVDHRKCSTT